MSHENVEIVRRLMERDERVRESGEPLSHSDLLAPDLEVDMSRRVFNPAVYRGIDGLARLYAEIRDVWEEFRQVPEQFIDAGDRVVVIETIHARGRGSGVELDARRSATIWTLCDGQVTRVQIGFEPEEALQAVGLEEAISENVDLVRSIYAEWERGDFGSVEWADPGIKWVHADGPEPGAFDREHVAQAWGAVLRAWDQFRIKATDYRELDDERVLALTSYTGKGHASGIEVRDVQANGAAVFHIRNGKVTRQVFYWDRERALADLGLTE